MDFVLNLGMTSILLAAVIFLGKQLIVTRLKADVKTETDIILENHKLQLKYEYDVALAMNSNTVKLDYEYLKMNFDRDFKIIDELWVLINKLRVSYSDCTDNSKHESVLNDAICEIEKYLDLKEPFIDLEIYSCSKELIDMLNNITISKASLTQIENKITYIANKMRSYLNLTQEVI